MRLTEKQFSDLQARRKPEKKARARKGPNRTEQAYMNALAFEFPHADIRYEPITFHMSNGHSYKPDIGVFDTYGPPLFVEVKNGAYRHASYGRARLAFDQCCREFPWFDFRWAEKTREGWTIK